MLGPDELERYARHIVLREVGGPGQAALKRDPLELRRELLAKSPKHLGVLEAVARRAGWGTPAPDVNGQKVYRGLAQTMGFGSYVAACAEVSVNAKGELKVHRIVAATDSGHAVNPQQIEAQVEGSFAYRNLDAANIASIAKIQLATLMGRLAKMDLTLEISKAALKELAKVGFDPVFGARPLKRAIQQRIENPLSKLILQGRFGPKHIIPVRIDGGEFAFERVVH